AKISGLDGTKRYGIERVSFQETEPARRFITLNEYMPDGSIGDRVAIFDTLGASDPAPPVAHGGRIEEVSLVEVGGSGISGSMTVDWAGLAGSGPNGGVDRWYYQLIPAHDGELYVPNIMASYSPV